MIHIFFMEVKCKGSTQIIHMEETEKTSPSNQALVVEHRKKRGKYQFLSSYIMDRKCSLLFDIPITIFSWKCKKHSPQKSQMLIANILWAFVGAICPVGVVLLLGVWVMGQSWWDKPRVWISSSLSYFPYYAYLATTTTFIG